jgi:hypothetical protein
MFTHFRKDQKLDTEESRTRGLVENIALKALPLIFVAILVYIFLVYGVLIALMSMFVGIVGFYLIFHGFKAAVKGKNKIVAAKEKRRYYPHDRE